MAAAHLQLVITDVAKWPTLAEDCSLRMLLCKFTDVVDGGGLMSVQPTTSFVLTQPPQPPPGSLVLTHRPGLASGSIVLSQPVAPEPPETIVLGHRGPSVPGSFVLTQPAPQPGTIVISQPCSAGAAAAPIGPFVPMLPAGADSRPQVSEGMATLSELQAAPVFSQAGRRHGVLVSKMDGETRGSDVSVYHIPSGSQLTVLQPVPGQQDPVSRPSSIVLDYCVSAKSQKVGDLIRLKKFCGMIGTQTKFGEHEYWNKTLFLSIFNGNFPDGPGLAGCHSGFCWS